MKDRCVFIHTNERQWLGALVAEYSLRRNSARPEAFDVQFIHTRDYPYLAKKEGQAFLRGGTTRLWRMDDLQSFTPLRFLPPKLMSWQGRAVDGWNVRASLGREITKSSASVSRTRNSTRGRGRRGTATVCLGRASQRVPVVRSSPCRVAAVRCPLTGATRCRARRSDHGPG